VKWLIKVFWLTSVACVTLAALLIAARAVGLLSCAWEDCWAPLVVPPVLMCVICFLLGLVDLTNATGKWARHCDRQARWESRPPRYIRRRRRS
jgi:hypothetical protein